MKEKIKIVPNGDSGMSIVFEKGISEDINSSVHHLAKGIAEADITGVVDIVPAYHTLLICYNPLDISYMTLKEQVMQVCEQDYSKSEKSRIVIHIPVLYGGEWGEDIETVASHNDLTIDEVISMHSSVMYRVYMLGFKPGFPYLGGMSDQLATPRLARPRLKILKGSVGIAGRQTGIYPQDSPGGWQLIGRTPLELVDWSKEELTIIEPGQYIKFDPIDKEGFEAIEEAVRLGTYTLDIECLEE